MRARSVDEFVAAVARALDALHDADAQDRTDVELLSGLAGEESPVAGS